MTKKETILKAITEMDINLLDIVLEDNISYMDVPKVLFLEKLEMEFQTLKKQGITNFDKVYKGTCNKCYKGCAGFTFLTKNLDYLDLLFLEKDNEIVDIFRCSDLSNTEEIKKEKGIYLSFNEDEKTDYIPSSNILRKQKKTQTAEREFEKFNNTTIVLDTLLIWFEKATKAYNNLHLREAIYYNCFKSFNSKYNTVWGASFLKTHHQIAKKAIEEFNSVERSTSEEYMVWLTKYQDNYVRLSASYNEFEKLDNNSLIVINKNVIVDVKKYKESIYFIDLFKATMEKL